MILSPDVERLNPGVNVDTLRVRVDKPIESESPLESDLYAQIERAGLPLPIKQVPLAKPLGRHWVYDAAWVEERIAYEVNGATYVKGGHSTGTGIHRDYEKANAAVLLGWRLFVFDSKMIKQPKDGSDSDAIATLRKAFEWLNTDEQKW
jgi:hypothetical protein